ncbi:hypothetical protein [Kamptonema formosum]|uniref:hypothetical protein n=1 Tax=Kamptonema formosum TaxID=331992 RepID=UPI00034B6FE9|nr:hypothetical protein [Oscillatoria sp. PCC 10802]
MLKPLTALFAGILALNAGVAAQAASQPRLRGKATLPPAGDTCMKVFDLNNTYANLPSTPNGQEIMPLNSSSTVRVYRPTSGGSSVQPPGARTVRYVFSQVVVPCSVTCQVVRAPNQTNLNIDVLTLVCSE